MKNSPKKLGFLRLFIVAILVLAGCGSTDDQTSADRTDTTALTANKYQNITVSLSFDDGNSDTVLAREPMLAHGYKGTWFLNSDKIGKTARLTLDQIRQLASDGHEIGGHTINHVHLPGMSLEQQKAAICDDRQALIAMGIPPPLSFAYPFGENDAQARQVAQSCGYQSARGTGGVDSQGRSSIYAETIPPLDPYMLRAFGSVQNTWDFNSIMSHIEFAADHGGGWLHYLFHHICPDDPAVACDQYGIRLGLFTSFLNELASRGISVKTVAQVMSIANLRNVSLEQDLDGNNIADCWTNAIWGSPTGTSERITPGRTGNYAQRLTITSSTETNADIKWLTHPACALNVTPGKSYTIRVWYRGGSKARFASYVPGVNGHWDWLAESSFFTDSSSWKQATWTTPVMTTDQLRIGLAQVGVGSIDFDDFSISQN